MQVWKEYENSLKVYGANPAQDRDKMDAASAAIDRAIRAVETLPRYILHDRKNPFIQREFILHLREMQARLARGVEVMQEAKEGSKFQDRGSRVEQLPRRFLELASEVWPLISERPCNLSTKSGGFIAFVVALSSSTDPSPALTESKCKNILHKIRKSKS